MQLGLGAAAYMSYCATSCVNSELNPDDRLLVWVAQKITGTVQMNGSRAPIQGAIVRYEASLSEGFYVPLGNGSTNQAGQFDLNMGTNFWVLEAGERRTYQVYNRLTVTKSGFSPAIISWQFPREATQSPPQGGLGPYCFTRTVTLGIPENE